MSAEKVVIIGASDQTDRFSNRALRMLQEYKHTPIPIHPKIKKIDGIAVLAQLAQVYEKVDTVTMYVRREISDGMAEALIKLNPTRVIFNPGSENPALEKKLSAAGIKTLEACTLVLLQTNSF